MHLSQSQCFGLTLVVSTLTLFNFPKGVATFQITTFGKAEDTTIKSKNFPGHYPAGDNVTWSWSVDSGYWGVVFLEFNLDPGLDGYGDYDRLELSDGDRNPTYHTARNPPVVPYTSQGSQLLVRFITDTQTGRKDFRGFQLRILYGNSEAELNRKISLAEVAKEKNRQPDESSEDKSTPVHVTTVVTLIAVFAIVVIVAVIAFRRSTFRKRLRRQSTVSVRTGRAEMLAGMTRVPTTPTTPSMPNSPRSPSIPVSPTQSAASSRAGSGSRRPSRSVQRSVSQQDWSARTELSCFSLESQERSAQPNDYARSEPTHQTNIKCTISHGGGAGGISVSSTITSSSVPDAAGEQQAQTGSEVVPPRRLRKSQSEKVMTSVGATARGDEVLRGVSCSLSKLSTIFDDSQEFDGAGDFVDTIDHLDPLPLEAIRGKNQLPPNLRAPQPPAQEQVASFDPQPEAQLDLRTTSPPPYFNQTSFDSCYENVFQNQDQASPQRKSSIYANQISIESGENHNNNFAFNNFAFDNFEPANQGRVDAIESRPTAQNQFFSSPAADLAGDYTYLKQSDGDSRDIVIPPNKAHDVSIDSEDVFGDALNKVVPIASNPQPTGRTHRLGSAYDIPPKSDDPYDIPPPAYKQTKGDDTYDIPPTSGKKQRGDDPYDIPPSSDKSPRGDDPYDIPPTSNKSRYNGSFETTPTAAVDLSRVPPRMNLDYVPTAMAARTQTKSDNPYDIPPSGRKF